MYDSYPGVDGFGKVIYELINTGRPNKIVLVLCKFIREPNNVKYATQCTMMANNSVISNMRSVDCLLPI